MENDDQRLVAAVLARQAGAFEQLVQRHQALVWHMVQRMVADAEDTRELSQEVFLRVHRRLPQFRFEASLATWIGRIAFSIAARHLRRKRLPLVHPTDDEEGEHPLDRLASDEDLEGSHAEADLVAHLGQALETLAPLPRTLVTLYHLDELGIPEIAFITGLPAGTVKSHLFRARRRLRGHLLQRTGEPS